MPSSPGEFLVLSVNSRQGAVDIDFARFGAGLTFGGLPLGFPKPKIPAVTPKVIAQSEKWSRKCILPTPGCPSTEPPGALAVTSPGGYTTTCTATTRCQVPFVLF